METIDMAKAKYEVTECAVCDWWSDKVGCCKDRSEEFGECLFQLDKADRGG